MKPLLLWVLPVIHRPFKHLHSSSEISIIMVTYCYKQRLCRLSHFLP